MLQIEKSTGPTNGILAQGNITSSDLMGSLAGKSIFGSCGENAEWRNLC